MIAFVVNQFPRQVDAYFLRELCGLAERGLDFRIYSLLPRPKGWKIHADAEPLVARTIYPSSPSRLAAAAAIAASRRPATLARLLARIVAGHRTMPTALAKSLAVMPQSLEFATDMRRRGVRHVHANWATYPGTAAMVISAMSDIPYSFTGHATDIFVHKAMLPEKIAGARFVITCTRFNREYLGDQAPEHRHRIRSVYHGVDLERFARPVDAERDRDLVISVGTLRACKGYEELIQAIAILRDRGRSTRLEIIGEGEDRPQLESLVRGLGLGDRVHLVGYRPQEEVIPVYHRASVVALPAHLEDHFGIPNILIEGLAAGAPVVCTELPSLGELVENGKSGLFVPEREPAALAEAIARFQDDPSAAAACAAEGRRRVVERFDMRQTTDELARIFRAAAQGATPNW